ncbi:MAG: DUF151 domain-containing protein [Bacteroidaceae bacterium]|nr:DUF151 domain-containing protein [Bacteroidaceae bacterium]
MLVELVINASAGTPIDDKTAMIILKEKNGERVLPIMTSARRASLLTMRAHFDMPVLLPFTPTDISCQLMEKFGVKLTRVEIVAIKDGVFFTRVVAEREGVEQAVDFCQAPDGLIMAVTARCPIYIEEDILAAQYMRPTGENTFAISINTLSRHMLEEALKHAVEEENYEAASHLRDELAKRTRLPGEQTASDTAE